MRRLAALAAFPFLLTGCYWNAGTSGSSGSSFDGQTRVRMAIPALEAYYADHGTYKGVTLGKLRQYDTGVTGVTVVSATATSYCLKSTGSDAYHKTGSAGEILPGPC